MTRSQVQPIGLDFGLDSIKMIQLEVIEDNALSVVAAARHVMPQEVRAQPELRLPVAMEAVREMLRSGGFSGRRVVAALPREIVHVKNLRLPVMPPAEIESAVQFEARNIFPFDTEKSVVRHLTAGEVRQGSDTKMEVIALAAKQEEINGFVEQLHRCGCIIESLDFEPCALYRSIERFIRRREDECDVHVLVEIGARRTQVVIGKGRDISFYKPIDIGSMRFQQDVADKLGITIEEAIALRRRLIEKGESAEAQRADPDSVQQAVHDAIRGTVENLAREISLCLRYYSVTFRGHRPNKLRVLGGEAGDTHLVSMLSAALPIPVETGRPLWSVDTKRMKGSGHSASEWAVALGLGLKQTRSYFGARDGKKRSVQGVGPGGDPSTGVEVIDIGQQLPEGVHA